MVLEFDYAIDRGEESIVSAATDIGARMDPGTALPDYDGACVYGLPAGAFDTQAFGFAVTAAACAAAAFFMSH
jgi:hypothetical protein